MFFFHPDFNCRFRNFTGSTCFRLKKVRGLYRRSGISPCPEEIIRKKMFRLETVQTDYKDTIIFKLLICSQLF